MLLPKGEGETSISLLLSEHLRGVDQVNPPTKATSYEYFKI